VSQQNQPITPVRQAIDVTVPLREAFRIFVDEIHTWWPLTSHSVGRHTAVSCAFEGTAGGRVYENHEDGSTQIWGTIIDWEPPHRVVFSWHPGRDAATAQEVELRFSEDGNRTRLELEHRGWEALGERAASARESYQTGWPAVLTSFISRCHAPDPP
jgi:uncharacterized protein YndB with AHSA1/START domain